MTDALPALARLIEVMARLRGPDGCPWDRAQTFATIAPYTIEEAHEVADAIARGDLEALREELGDLLLQVVFHARLAEEAGAFSLKEVAEAIVAKLVRRHPHVFGPPAALPPAAPPPAQLSPAEASDGWEAMKAAERGSPSVLDGIAPGLPALIRAQKLGRRAARAGFDWTEAAAVRAKLREELAELDAAADRATREEEAGDLLFAIAQWLRHLEIDAETALAAANRKFERRFRAIEQHPEFSNLSTSEKELLWQAAKQGASGRGGPGPAPASLRAP